MGLICSFERLELPLEFPFTISRGTRDSVELLVVRIKGDDGRIGIGGAGPTPHYGETIATAEAVLPTYFEIVEDVGDPHQLAQIEAGLVDRVHRNPAARCAISIALHDLAAQHAGLPLYRYWGLNSADTIETSYTIGIDTTERMREKTKIAVQRGFSTLKIKLGTERDQEIVETVRSAAPDATIRVDANEAWTPRTAVERIEQLVDFDIEFVEQPVPAEDPAGLKFVYDRSPLPIAADESCITVEDIPTIADRADIANIKLMKCGGLREAIRMIHTANALGLETMLGCMLETNASIAAGCHLAPLLDYADLDGSLLLAADPFEGVPIRNGSIALDEVTRSGIGVVHRDD